MIAISGQIETAREQFFTHQVVDHKLLFSPITKWAGRVEPGSVGTVMRKACGTASAERPARSTSPCGGDDEQGAGDRRRAVVTAARLGPPRRRSGVRGAGAPIRAGCSPRPAGR